MMFKRLFGHCWSVINVTERYVEQSVVGGVSNSTVVSAFDTVARKKVVLKKAKNSIEKRNNIDEYALLKSLNHPNIIDPTDLVTEGLGFMVLRCIKADDILKSLTRSSNPNSLSIPRNLTIPYNGRN